ncbi:MAG TPA: BON domain-containing protein [Tepidiformaceae bacterium]|nr:BON domain-containing protein [Tepidiformaceae bacterium]
MSMLTKRIERRLEDEAGILVTVEEEEDRLVLSGMVENEDLRETAQDIVAEVAPGRDIVNELDVMEVIPAEIGALEVAETRTGMMEGASPELADDESMEPGDFTDQETLGSAQLAGGPSMSLEDDEVSEGGEVWVPPTDPVGTNREIIGGLSASSLDSVEVDRSSDGTLGDEGIADAVRRELREDAATTDLELEIEVVEGVVYIRGTVALLEDAENAEAVAATVPGVLDVIDETEVEGLG